ncbi:MAG: tetraacyldisaccharide 4'-kinase [Gammaproteobacteria bacterium]|nr:tetraacyldisaccharide 4'-kinase [Gammaproteobacteria bacterium]
MPALDHYWYSLNPVSLALLPLAGLFWLLAGLRRQLYRLGLLRSVRLPRPVIVVGNISVGGSGKSPLVIALARHLQALGYRPGIISRGHGGRASHWPQPVHADSDPLLLGDEPVMIAEQTGCPVWVGPDRVAAAQALLAQQPCDLLISDDGLQHYRLQRDLEIALIDGTRRFGNGLPLPAGPLREPPSRLTRVDWCLVKGRAGVGEAGLDLALDLALDLHLGEAINLQDPSRRLPLSQFIGSPVHAIAGIGHPESFFALLRQQGLELIEHAFDDHHPFQAADLAFGGEIPLLMTAKDGVKCRPLAQPWHWVVPLQASLPPAFTQALEARLAELCAAYPSPGVSPGARPGATSGAHHG